MSHKTINPPSSPSLTHPLPEPSSAASGVPPVSTSSSSTTTTLPTHPPTSEPTPAPASVSTSAAPDPEEELGPVLGPARPPPNTSTTSTSSLPEVDLSFLDAPTQQPDPNDQEQQQQQQQQQQQPPEPPRSPYSSTRALLRDLTLPAVANMDIPPSPPGTPPAGHAELTAKVENLLQLKRTKGVHFNERLAGSAGMRNPALTDKLLRFVGIETEFGGSGDGGGGGGGGGGSGGRSSNDKATEQYDTVLSAEVWDPHCFPEWAFRGALRRTQERVAKERERGLGEPVEFVPASGSAGGSAGSGAGAAGFSGLGSAAGSRSGTPGSGPGRRRGRADA